MPPRAPLRLCHRKFQRNRKGFAFFLLNFMLLIKILLYLKKEPPSVLPEQRSGGVLFHYARNGERIYRVRRKMLPPFGGPICVKPADSNMASAMRLV